MQAAQAKSQPSHPLNFVVLNRVALDRPDLFPTAHSAAHSPRRRRASQSARRRSSMCQAAQPPLRPASAPCKQQHGVVSASSRFVKALDEASDAENEEDDLVAAGVQAASVISKLFSHEGQVAAAQRRKVLARLHVRPGSGGSPCKSCALGCRCLRTPMHGSVHACYAACSDSTGYVQRSAPWQVQHSATSCRAKFAHAVRAQASEHEARCVSARTRKAEIEAQASAERRRLARRNEQRTEQAAAMQLARQHRAEATAEARPWRLLVELAVRLHAVKVRLSNMCELHLDRDACTRHILHPATHSVCAFTCSVDAWVHIQAEILLQREVRRERATLDAAARSIQTCYRMYRLRQRHHAMIDIVRDVRRALTHAFGC